MKIVVINCGSSSVKVDLLESGKSIAYGRGQRLGSNDCCIRLEHRRSQESVTQALPGGDHKGCLALILPWLIERETSIVGVGHRVVHGGQSFTFPTVIDQEVIAELEKLSPLAPLHNPANLTGIEAARALLPDIAHIAVFDTAFHASLPRRAREYALAQEITRKQAIRRYGFHGPSHQWVSQQAAEYLGEKIRTLRIISCHLGNGASVCAVEYGRSVETSMGMTPLEGLVMGSRCGDIDPGVLLNLLRDGSFDVESLDRLLNKQSGLLGLSGFGNDLRDIENRAVEGDERCRLAIQVFAHRLRKYIGAYAAVMGGVDVIVFTAGIGENSALVRHRVAQRLDYLGARIDEDKNRAARVDSKQPVAEISQPHSRTRLLVVATDEAQCIAEQTAAIIRDANSVDTQMAIPIAISARHIHLTQDAVHTLFGAGHQLTPYNPLSQPGQYACEEKLTLVGPKNRLEGVRVLGPTRGKCQVEISRTDEFKLGVDAPVRDSGDVANSPGITLQGPAGVLTLEQGLICARRHIHMTPEDAERFGVQHRDVVEVVIDSKGRDLIFGDVLIRVRPYYSLEMHIDTDEANAAEISSDHIGELIATGKNARIQRKSVDLPGINL